MKPRKLFLHLAVIALAWLALPAAAPAEPPAAIQYGFAPLPSASGKSTLKGDFPAEQPELLPETVRNRLTGAAGAQLRVVATSPQLGVPSITESLMPAASESGGAWQLALALALALATGFLIAVFRRRRGAGRPDGAALLRLGVLGAVVAALVAIAVTATDSSSQELPEAPPGFFGIVPQEELDEEDVARMSNGGLESIRAAVQWGTIEPEPGAYGWDPLDQLVAVAASEDLEVVPFLYGTPTWLGEITTLPVRSEEQRTAWRDFLRAAVRRYGPGGEFWEEHSSSSADPLPEVPIRAWQIWNEANLFYFAKPASPQLYARLLEVSAPAIRAEDPSATIVASGLFGRPVQKPPQAVSAADFLEQLYDVPGIERSFDAVALHPYAPDAATLGVLVTDIRNVLTAAGDGETPIWLTEMGWRSEEVGTVFARGIEGQAQELRNAYEYLLRNQEEVGVERIYWFAWQDDPPPFACNFCDSIGLFEAGSPLRPKPAWGALVELTGGEPE